MKITVDYFILQSFFILIKPHPCSFTKMLEELDFQAFGNEHKLSQKRVSMSIKIVS